MVSITNEHRFRASCAIPYVALIVSYQLLTCVAADGLSGFHVLGSRFVTNDEFNSVVGPDDGVSLSLPSVGGSGFESLKNYSFGTFSMEMKLMSGYSAGVCATFYLQQGDKDHRTEWDFEFLGSDTNGRGINIQTNYWQFGFGDREVRFLPSFDPSESYHVYTIDWQKLRTRFLVDGVVIRTVKNSGGYYPLDPFRVYGSIWNASDWATGPHNSRIPINYAYQPWTVVFRHFSYTQATSNRVKKSRADSRN